MCKMLFPICMAVNTGVISDVLSPFYPLNPSLFVSLLSAWEDNKSHNYSLIQNGDVALHISSIYRLQTLMWWIEENPIKLILKIKCLRRKLICYAELVQEFFFTKRYDYSYIWFFKKLILSFWLPLISLRQV